MYRRRRHCSSEYLERFIILISLVTLYRTCGTSNADLFQFGTDLKLGTQVTVAFPDIDTVQRQAELRDLVGDEGERGKGCAEEAAALWVTYRHKRPGLEEST
jgi:hypothetical protein